METKACFKCHVVKPLSEYHKRAARPDGRYHICKECRKPITAAYHKENREERLAKMRVWRDDHHTERLAYMREDALKRNYHLTLAEYMALHDAQGGLCFLCGKPETAREWRGEKKPKMLAVDHDRRCCPGARSCGKCVRGLLCFKCNRDLAIVDNDEWLQKAIPYRDRRPRETANDIDLQCDYATSYITEQRRGESMDILDADMSEAFAG